MVCLSFLGSNFVKHNFDKNNIKKKWSQKFLSGETVWQLVFQLFSFLTLQIVEKKTEYVKSLHPLIYKEGEEYGTVTTYNTLVSQCKDFVSVDCHCPSKNKTKVGGTPCPFRATLKINRQNAEVVETTFKTYKHRDDCILFQVATYRTPNEVSKTWSNLKKRK